MEQELGFKISISLPTRIPISPTTWSLNSEPPEMPVCLSVPVYLTQIHLKDPSHVPAPMEGLSWN